MLMSFWGQQPDGQGEDGEQPSRQRQPRRGATALEYLVCISTILVVVIITVQHLGSIVNTMFANNAKATAATNQPAP
jgi:Flp pilus assembly pilin Flp